MGLGALEYAIYILGGLNKVGISFTIHIFRLTFENLSGVILPVLFTWIIIHLGTIRMTHCSSQYYSLKMVLIVALSLKCLFTIHYS